MRTVPHEGDLKITLITGTTIQLVGLDKPFRLEGREFIDEVMIDEYAQTKADAWKLSLRPALSTIGREGRAVFIGKPLGRNHWYDMCQSARHKRGWVHLSWPSSDIISAEEIEEARNDLDELSFRQEYGAEFVSFSGRAYYKFNIKKHVKPTIYDPEMTLDVCFDFNVDPGVAVIVQTHNGLDYVLGEVHIPRNSNTELVSRKVATDWGSHKGNVRYFGDATGGNRGSAKLQGSDWDIVREVLSPVFGARLRNKVPRGNPSERARVNAVNARFETASGVRRCFIDPQKCPNLIKDLEGVVVVSGGSGEIDKKADKRLTHLTDAFGYRQYALYGSHGVVVRGGL